MSSSNKSLSTGYFERLYARNSDPWRFASSEYEHRKYAATLATLEDRRFRSAFEVGCSIGVFTRLLADRCESLLAVDAAEQPLEEARRSCAGLRQVKIERMQVPQKWPACQFDLIVLSEILYYFSRDDIRRIAERSMFSLTADGVVLLVHWTGPTNYPCPGDEAVEHYTAACRPELRSMLNKREPKYRLDLLTRTARTPSR